MQELQESIRSGFKQGNTRGSRGELDAEPQGSDEEDVTARSRQRDKGKSSKHKKFPRQRRRSSTHSGSEDSEENVTGGAAYDPKHPTEHLFNHERSGGKVCLLITWSTLSTLTAATKAFVLKMWKEYTLIPMDKDFPLKVNKVSAEELQRFENGTLEPTTSIPLKFDVSHGMGTAWNKRLFIVLSQECILKMKELPEKDKFVLMRVQLPQLQEFFAKRFQDAWNYYARTLLRVGETAQDALARNVAFADRTDTSKRENSSRSTKFDKRLAEINKRLARKDSVRAMKYAHDLLDLLGKDGMSSEEETNDGLGAPAFATSQMTWRHADIHSIFQKIDTLGRQSQDPRGAIAAPRLEGRATRRGEVKDMPFEFYDQQWLCEKIARGEAQIGKTGRPRWMTFSKWESLL